MTPIRGASQDGKDSSVFRSLYPIRMALCAWAQKSYGAILIAGALSAFILVWTLIHSPISVSAESESRPGSGRSSSNPDKACAACHREIYENYERTPMARGSGAA